MKEKPQKKTMLMNVYPKSHARFKTKALKEKKTLQDYMDELSLKK